MHYHALFHSLVLFATSVHANEAPVIDQGEPTILSAYFGLNDGIQNNNRSQGQACAVDGDMDGMPLVFNYEIDQRTLDPEDFVVETQDGKSHTPICATTRPANNEDEDRTVLLLGEFGSADNPPISVRVVGSILTEENQQGEQYDLIDFDLVSPTPAVLSDGPTLVMAETVDRYFSSRNRRWLQVVRVVWNGGVTQFNTDPTVFPPGAGAELGPEQYQSIWFTVENELGLREDVNPVYMGDRDDGDNNNEFYLKTNSTPISVRVEANTVTDPENDYNPETSVMISR